MPNSPHHDFHWLAGMLAGAGLLVIAAVFISSGGLGHSLPTLATLGVSPQSQGAFAGAGDFGGFANTTGGIVGVIGDPVSPDPVSYGGSATVTFFCRFANIGWLYDGHNPPRAVGVANTGNYPGSRASFSVGPLYSTTQYEVACQGNGFANSSVVNAPVNAPPQEPVLNISANPSSIAYGARSTIAWSAANASSCVVNNDWGQVGSGTSGSQDRGPFNDPPSEHYTLVCQSPAGERTKSTTVNIGAAPAPQPSDCSNGLNYGSYGPSCSCPSGQHQEGNWCFDNSPPTCSNGLAYGTYGPSCSCPTGQHQEGSSCVPDVCSNGLNINSYPSCSCPTGQHQEGNACVANTCSNGLNYSIYGPSCTCPSGQIQPPSSDICTAPGQPTASIWADSPSVQVNQQVQVHATFAAGSNDTIVGTNIDSPEGSGLAPTTAPGPKDITFTPTAPGTYIFYARVATTNYGWQSKDTVSIDVSAIPPPGVPQNLQASCNVAGTSVTTSWGSVAGADHYWVGLDDSANNSGSCNSGWMCATPPDYSQDMSATSKSFSTTPEHSMRLMVSSCTAGETCSAANELDFTCNLPQPQLSITANGQTGLAAIPVNTPITIAWSSQDVEAGSCKVANTGDSTVWQEDNSSGHNIGALAITRIYTLNCNKVNGAPASPASVTISIQPGSIDGPLTATPARVQQGSNTVLTWHTVGMTDCSLDSNTTGHVSGALASSGTQAAVPHATTFVLTCHDGTHNFSQSVDVGVIPVVREE